MTNVKKEVTTKVIKQLKLLKRYSVKNFMLIHFRI